MAAKREGSPCCYKSNVLTAQIVKCRVWDQDSTRYNRLDSRQTPSRDQTRLVLLLSAIFGKVWMHLKTRASRVEPIQWIWLGFTTWLCWFGRAWVHSGFVRRVWLDTSLSTEQMIDMKERAGPGFWPSAIFCFTTEKPMSPSAFSTANKL